MKDYYQMELDEFRKNNILLLNQIRKDAGKYSEALGISVAEFIDLKTKEALGEQLLTKGVQDKFFYLVNKHEPDSELALRLVKEHQEEIDNHLVNG